MADVAAAARIGAFLEAGADRLRAAGAPGARRTAAHLLAALLERPPGQLLLEVDRAVDPDVSSELFARLERIVRGEPLAYVLGTAGFRTLDLVVDRRVLIPRPETEGLVELVLAWAGRHREAGWGRAADVGTGSGCIALSLAVEGRFERIVATDASTEALAVASANRDRVRPAVPIELREGDLLAPLGAERFDVIVSNPPYVSEAEWQALDASVRAYEPAQALVSSEDGMEHIRRMLEGSSSLLYRGGLLAIEIDSRRPDAALALARRIGWHDPVVRRDLFGRHRYLLVTKG
jgi:release factor glutamine methyltransferase